MAYLLGGRLVISWEPGFWVTCCGAAWEKSALERYGIVSLRICGASLVMAGAIWAGKWLTATLPLGGLLGKISAFGVPTAFASVALVVSLFALHVLDPSLLKRGWGSMERGTEGLLALVRSPKESLTADMSLGINTKPSREAGASSRQDRTGDGFETDLHYRPGPKRHHPHSYHAFDSPPGELALLVVRQIPQAVRISTAG